MRSRPGAPRGLGALETEYAWRIRDKGAPWAVEIRLSVSQSGMAAKELGREPSESELDRASVRTLQRFLAGARMPTNHPIARVEMVWEDILYGSGQQKRV